MAEFYAQVILLINQSEEIGEKQLSDLAPEGGQNSPLMDAPLSVKFCLYSILPLLT